MTNNVKTRSITNIFPQIYKAMIKRTIITFFAEFIKFGNGIIMF